MGDRICTVIEPDGTPCPRPHVARGYCGRHYQRWKTTGNANHVPQRDKTDMQRFLEKVDVGDCWEWTASRDWDGYGIFHALRRSHRAHRWIYEALVERIADDHVIDHLCRNRGCVNPAHLQPTPNRLNILRGFGMGGRNYSKVRCDSGHDFDLGNTAFTKEGHRVCRRCSRENTVRWRRAKQAANLLTS